MPFTLTDDALNALLDQLPVLAGRPRRLEDLSGGLTNRNVKVSTDNGVYVARCADPANLLGIDRESEFYNSRAAEQAGVGAPVIDYRPDLGILLVGFLNGVTLTNDDFQRPGVIAKVAAGCRALHAGPRFRGDFDMFALQPQYLKVVLDNGFRLPAGYLEFGDKFDRIRRTLRHKLARARLQGTVSQYGWTLWGCIQNGSSTLDFDFWEWAMERYDNAVAEFTGREFDRLLDDVQ